MTGCFRNPWAAATSKLRLTTCKEDGLIGLGGSLVVVVLVANQAAAAGPAWAPGRPPATAYWAGGSPRAGGLGLVTFASPAFFMIKGFFRNRSFLAALLS